MRNEVENDLRDFFNGWLDALMTIYGEVLEEWEKNDYVQPFPGAQVTFK